MLCLNAAIIIILSIFTQALAFSHQREDVHHRQRRDVPRFDDPEYQKAFYLNDKFGVTMNIIKAWDAGYTGKNVTICVIDPQGVNLASSDLASKYVAQASYDFKDNDTTPSTTNADGSARGPHGTQMAGVAVAKANNRFCSVGVAYDASFSAAKFAATGPTEEYGARSSFLLHNNINDIFLCSWGPMSPLGQTIGYMKPTIGPAIKQAVEQGRNGKGNLILFSVGNGGRFNNSCSFDEFISSIYTISISVVTGKNIGSRQNVKCPGVSAVTYARDGSLGIPYPDDLMPVCGLDATCERTTLASSAANAVGAGIMALLLQAKPSLGWRDVQHLIARSSCSEFNSIEWKTNKAGLRVSDEFGFGLLDAYALIDNAKTWNNVESQKECILEFNSAEPIHGVNTMTKTVDMTTWPASCGGESNKINYLEHVVLLVNLNFTMRKNIELLLESPTGTKSLMLRSGRTFDRKQDIKNLPILSLHHWGESPKGVWTIKLRNVIPNAADKGTLFNWALKFYGTANDPMATNTVRPSQIRIKGFANTTMSTSSQSPTSTPNPTIATSATTPPRATTLKSATSPKRTAARSKSHSINTKTPVTENNRTGSTISSRTKNATATASSSAIATKIPTTKPNGSPQASRSPMVVFMCIFQVLLAIYYQ